MALFSLFSLILLCLLQPSSGASIPATPKAIVCAADSRHFISNDSDSNIWPWQAYRSSSAQPPVLQTDRTGEALFNGLLFFDVAPGAAITAAKQISPYVMTDTGDLVWSGPTGPSYNVRVQEYNGAPVLTHFSGEGTAGASAVVGHGYGGVIVRDTSYNVIARVCPKLNHFTMETGVTAECHADLHESFITPRNTMLVTAYNTTRADLTSVGGPKDGWILDSMAVELNITTGEVLFLWSPLAHLPLNKSHFSLAGIGAGQGHNQSVPWDFFHINAIELVGENYLINSRHYWSTFLVNPQGKILWEINGLDGGDFGKLPEGAAFSWQHFARVQSINSTQAVISWFGNNNYLPDLGDMKPTTGVTLQLTLPPDPSSPPVLITNLTDPALRVDAWSQGSFLHLPNGNMFMGYGSDPVMVEYGPPEKGATVANARWSATFGYGDLVSSYRSYKQVWHATPATNPDLIVLEAEANDQLHCAGNSTYRGYVSWNGATDVTAWMVYAGATNNSLNAVGRAMKFGFETEFAVPNDAMFVQVGAIENTGNTVVRKSRVVAAGK
ncbi:uncharacterized protein Z519_08049 [Cladophialophora bantiana CBS 173.52]|uniref:Arylsulfotransferase n=1 Tax=Cladophialophora bantiana (strain ATCC 10958 / CBS 173.52 / CDC B-1940 / NIH 8579) TaxID=1442370 RepID=A0A0D2I2N8_CLAB1|nr:uncharacterized protein Z519_08049 [Cladophialophora bantiana CBS 173.52]KIW91154.1 hypothetical protein Z519_08049 [Cladophialophora bantiana CBS 173.52]